MVRRRFAGTAFWEARLVADELGGAKASFETVCAAHALVLADLACIPVPRPTLDRVLRYVENLLRESRDGSRSYALYVLALAGTSGLEGAGPAPRHRQYSAPRRPGRSVMAAGRRAAVGD